MQTEPNPAISDVSSKASPTEDPSSIASATEDLSPKTSTTADHPSIPLATEQRPSTIPVLSAEQVINQRLTTVDQAALARLVAPENGNYQLSTINHHPAPAVIDAKPLPVTAPQRRKSRRNGRIASLPKLNRDMVNRMLWNGVPYKNIVAALDEVGLTVTERNISNWATGGHLEWRFEQDLVLQNRLDQDHLVDHLRREDASELPEVGLQAAATRLSQILLQKTASGEELQANLGTFSQMVDVLCRLNREIGILQKQRDDSQRTLGPSHDPARIKDADQFSVMEHERHYSDPDSDSGLKKPAVPPLLPPIPTSEILANADREAAVEKQIEGNKRLLKIIKSFSPKDAAPVGQAFQPVQPPTNNRPAHPPAAPAPPASQ